MAWQVSREGTRKISKKKNLNNYLSQKCLFQELRFQSTYSIRSSWCEDLLVPIWSCFDLKLVYLFDLLQNKNAAGHENGNTNLEKDLTSSSKTSEPMPRWASLDFRKHDLGLQLHVNRSFHFRLQFRKVIRACKFDPSAHNTKLDPT